MADLQSLAIDLYDIGAVKFGEFTLKSGIRSPVYFDLRLIVSYPAILARVSDVLWAQVSAKSALFQSICGVPYTALPIATLISAKHNLPMLMRRKEAKTYGTKKLIEGVIVEGNNTLVVEDVVTSGSSVLETCSDLMEAELMVAHAVVLLDREQGGKENIKRGGVELHSVFTLSQLMKYLLDGGKITMETVAMVQKFISANSQLKVVKRPINPAFLSYSERSQSASNPVAKRLLSLMDSKRTNLAFSADLTTSQQLVKLADLIGPYICVLKTHVDIIPDFTPDVGTSLKKLAAKHNFIIMEDRKFADIGNTVQLQYRISSRWADLVTCHALPGPGVIEGLLSTAPDERGCVIVAEMSTVGSLATEEYTRGAISLAESHLDFVAGVVTRSRVSGKPQLVHMTPGIRESSGDGDGLGQQYMSAETAIGEKLSDIIIVGRGIYTAADPVAAARLYRDKGFEAYRLRVPYKQ